MMTALYGQKLRRNLILTCALHTSAQHLRYLCEHILQNQHFLLDHYFSTIKHCLI